MPSQNLKNAPAAFRLKFNAVVVIQSLPAGEPQTGKQLYDDIIARRCNQTGKASYFYDPGSKVELFNALDEICAFALHDELMPIIHFEVHGSKSGLVLKAGEQVTWKELQEHCRFINVQISNQLIITLATCWGSGIWQMIDIAKPAPYWGYIGPKGTIQTGILMQDFTEFYDSLLSAFDWDEALWILKANGTRDQYIYLHCKGIFEYFIEGKLREVAFDKKAAFHRLKGKAKDHLPGNRSARRIQLKLNIKAFDRKATMARLKKIFLMT